MNNRGKTLFIVEGAQEKNQLFYLICKCFEELQINLDDVLIYGTNIYCLYDDIVNEYGDRWSEDDIDIAYIVTRKKNKTNYLRKNQFKNIFLIFDYERHDPKFSDEKINRMMNYFDDTANNGKLYLNYPMFESYMDINDSDDFINLNIDIFKMTKGDIYKNLVKKRSKFYRLITFPYVVCDILKKQGINEDNIIKISQYIYELEINNYLAKNIEIKIREILGEKNNFPLTFSKKIENDLIKVEKLQNHNFIFHMKKILIKILMEHVKKAYILCVKNLPYDNLIEEVLLDKNKYELIEHIILLDKQNKYANEQNKIWILSTFLFLILDYNSEFIAKFNSIR